jgi:outer membrane protein assembly factor BamB
MNLVARSTLDDHGDPMSIPATVKRLILTFVAVATPGVSFFIAACNQGPASSTATPAGANPKGRGLAVSLPRFGGERTERVWHMYGGAANRNMVNTVERNLPVTWNYKTRENIKWDAKLGSKSYGNPTVHGGKIFLGTNNENARNPRDTQKRGTRTVPIDRGILMCFREADGKFLWQAVHDKLPAGRVVDWPEEGICSSPYIEGDRVYYVSNRCELVCADVEGFANGNQGVRDEKYKTETDVDMIWRLDMMEELSVFPHNLAVCSPLIVGDIVYVVTGNGHDESHENIPSPRAPSFIAVDKNTGKVLWEDSSPGEKILHGQWSNPTYAEINGKSQVIFPGGDGWLYAFEPKTGKLIWKFDCNPKSAKYILGSRGTRNEIIATPVVYENRVYVGVGQDPEHGEGVGHLWCIDPSKAAADNVDLSAVNDNFDPKAEVNKKSGLVWHHGGVDGKGEFIFRRTMSTCAIHEGICYAANLSGILDVLDAKTGQLLWRHDTLTAIWGSPYVVDGKVYLGTEEGDVYVFQHGREKKQLAKNEMDGPVLSTPIAVNGVLYIMGRSNLWAIQQK